MGPSGNERARYSDSSLPGPQNESQYHDASSAGANSRSSATYSYQQQQQQQQPHVNSTSTGTSRASDSHDIRNKHSSSTKSETNFASPSSQPKLRPGWEAVKDPASGLTYYWNIDTNETTWEIPSM